MPKSTKSVGVRRSVLIRAPRELAFAAMHDEEKLRQWYYDDAGLDFRVGGTIGFHGMEGVVEATFLEIEEPTRIVMEYHPPWWGVVTWQFETVSQGSTRVHLTHVGFETHEDWVDRFAWGWESILKSLKACVEGKPTR